MAIVPNRQFCPTSTTFFTSFSTFHLTKLHSLSCSNSSSCNKWIDMWNEPRKRCSRKEVRAVLNFRIGGNASSSSYGNGDSSSGSSTMDKIVEKLKKFGYNDDVNENGKVKRVIEKGSFEDILRVEEGKLQNGRGRFLDDSSLGNENVFGGDGEARFPWENTAMREREETRVERRKSKTSMAEMTLPEQELTRLRNLAVRTKHKTKIGGGGVTQAVVEMIHEKWKVGEIVRLKIEGAPALNMRRMHEILERKTGGLVIWRSGTSISLYRGVSYVDPLVYHMNKKKFENSNDRTNKDPSKGISDHTERHKITNNTSWRRRDGDASYATKGKEDEPVVEVIYENEVDALLDGLGPRYTDWAGCDPLPVDADLLPATVPDFRPPYRVLPYGLRATIGQKEATSLRRLARVLPPHFALGRSRQLQGLAVAMIKLWERSSIAKVSLKRGVPLTTSERMAEDLKRLTGGVLLSRNKDFLVFYRGNNYLSPEVTKALLERESLATTMQDEEEQARLRASSFFTQGIEAPEQSGTAGTLSETMDADACWAKKLDNRGKEIVMREAEVMRHATLVRKLERKLAFAVRKINKAERALSKVEAFLKPAEPSADPESITDEERYMLRKLGLRMKAFLLLGRRGVFDGTVENMHLHWKYRELVKIIVNAKTFEQVKKVAIALEAESGGVLVSVDKISKGYAVIVFRGHDYHRPSLLRPKNLLTKRKALARSIELQRREALYNHISTLQRGVDKLKSEIEQMNIVKHDGDEELYEKLDSAYSTDNDDTEDGGDEAYLETVDCEVDSHGSVLNLFPETDFPYEDEDEEGDSKLEFQSPVANVYPEVSALSERANERQKEGPGI